MNTLCVLSSLLHRDFLVLVDFLCDAMSVPHCRNNDPLHDCACRDQKRELPQTV